MSILSACRSSFVAAVSVAALSGLICGAAQAQSRPDLDALVYGAASKASTTAAPVEQPVVQQTPQVAPRGLFTSMSASPSTSGGALSAIGGMFKREPRMAAQPMDAQAQMSPAQTAPRNDLDMKTYNEPPYPAPAPQRGLLTNSKYASSGGALAAIGTGFRSSSRRGYGPEPVRYAAPPPPPVPYDPTYRVDAGDRLRIVVYGQDGLTNTYQIAASGSITMPLIGGVPARGRTPAELAGAITGRLRDGFIREPSVAVEIEAYRPFFILGEVAAPGQYPYVPNMSVESAVAIAGGFSPRAKRDRVTLTHAMPEGLLRAVVPTNTPLSPGDTILVGERWF